MNELGAAGRSTGVIANNPIRERIVPFSRPIMGHQVNGRGSISSYHDRLAQSQWEPATRIEILRRPLFGITQFHQICAGDQIPSRTLK